MATFKPSLFDCCAAPGGCPLCLGVAVAGALKLDFLFKAHLISRLPKSSGALCAGSLVGAALLQGIPDCLMGTASCGYHCCPDLFEPLYYQLSATSCACSAGLDYNRRTAVRATLGLAPVNCGDLATVCLCSDCALCQELSPSACSHQWTQSVAQPVPRRAAWRQPAPKISKRREREAQVSNNNTGLVILMVTHPADGEVRVSTDRWFLRWSHSHPLNRLPTKAERAPFAVSMSR